MGDSRDVVPGHTIETLFGKRMHKIRWWIIKLALISGLISYIYMILKLA